jgi:hypothetical protein
MRRQKMYERIIHYKDSLIFERKKRSRHSSGSDGQEALSSWKEPSEEAKSILHRLIKGNKSERMTAQQLLETDWLKVVDGNHQE